MERFLRERPAVRRLDVVLAGVLVVLTLATLALLAEPDSTFVLVDRSLDVAVNSVTALAAASLTALTYARYREGGRVAGLYQSAAFLVMAVTSAVSVLLVVLKIDTRVGLTLGLPEQLPLYVWSLTRIVSAVLLVAGGLVALSSVRTSPPRIGRTLLAPVAGLALVTIVLYPLRDLLPPFIGEPGIQALIEGPRVEGVLPGMTPIAVAIEGAAVILYLAAALVYRRTYVGMGPVLDGFLAAGLVLVAFSELHFIIYPGLYSGLVTTSDGLRLGFFLVMLLGIDAEGRSDLRALRSAYSALDRMRTAEADRGILEERARLARELHDGLAQDLWFAKLKHERLASQVPDEVRPLAGEVGQALDAAIAEAKQAMVTMRLGVEQELPVRDLLERAVDDFATRSGLRADFSAGDLPRALPPRRQAELLRVVQEALTNVRKHADATVVRLHAESDGSTLRITIVDNGRGFRPEEARSGDGLGLQGMVERARLMGGELVVRSEPAGGTEVRLDVPLAAAAT